MEESMRRVRLSLLLASAGLIASTALSQQARIEYPPTRTVDTVDTYGSVKVPDPYRWLEDLDSKEVADWVKAENAVTMPYLAALPGRDAIRERITALYNYARTSVPFWEGGRWWYTKNSGLQKQSVWYSRVTLTGAEETIIDPNQLSPDGSTALSEFTPSPDGRHFAYGLSEGGSDWVTLYVRDLDTGKNTSDIIKWVKFSSAEWTKDGQGFFYSRFPEPAEGKKLEAKLEHQTFYYHKLGTEQAADIKIYERPDQPSWFVGGAIDETRRYLFVYTSRGTDKNELYLADLGDPMRPNVQARIRPVVTGQDANYSALGVVNGKLFMTVEKMRRTAKSSQRRWRRRRPSIGRR